MANRIPEKLLRVLDSVVAPNTGRAIFEYYHGKRNACALALLDAYPELRDQAVPRELYAQRDTIDRLFNKCNSLERDLRAVTLQYREVLRRRSAERPDRNTAALNAHITRLTTRLERWKERCDIKEKVVDALSARIHDLKCAVTARDQEIAEFAAHIVKLNKIIDEKNLVIETLRPKPAPVVITLPHGADARQYTIRVPAGAKVEVLL